MMPLALILSALGLVQNESDNWRTLHPEWIWSDDFEADRTGSYFEYNNAGGAFVRVAGAGLNGSTAMRVRYQAGQVDAGWLHLAFGRTPSASFRPVDAGTRNYRDIYWRFYLRNQPGWTGGAGWKLSRAILFANSNWAEAAIGHLWGQTNTLLLDPASGTDTAGNLKTTQYNDFANLRWLGQAPGTTPLFDAAHVGKWYCVEAHMQLNTPGQSDGVFEFWIDGQLQARKTGMNWVGSFTAYGINSVFLENYWNGGSPALQERYIDNFVVSTQPIGPVGQTGSPTHPTITHEPQSLSVAVGQTATFSVTATGTAPISYLWKRSNDRGTTWNDIGSNSSSVTTSPTTASDNGALFEVVVTNTAGSVTSTTATLTVTSSGGGTGGGGSSTSGPVAIDSGGGAVGSFLADKDFSGGSTASTTAAIDTSGVNQPAPQAVYQTERWGSFTYTIPGLSPGATYTVRLHFAEIRWTASGQRVFNVAINGMPVLTNFDIVAAAGGTHRAIVKEFTASADGTGQVAIHYTPGPADWPKSSGLEIVPASGSSSSAASGGGGPTPAHSGGGSGGMGCGLLGLEVLWPMAALGLFRRNRATRRGP